MSIDNGESGQVSHEAYCMKDSIEAKTNAEMNQKMGYFNSADMANSKPYPVQMNGEKRNTQIMGDGAGDNDYNYNANRS